MTTKLISRINKQTNKEKGNISKKEKMPTVASPEANCSVKMSSNAIRRINALSRKCQNRKNENFISVLGLVEVMSFKTITGTNSVQLKSLY